MKPLPGISRTEAKVAVCKFHLEVGNHGYYPTRETLSRFTIVPLAHFDRRLHQNRTKRFSAIHFLDAGKLSRRPRGLNRRQPWGRPQPSNDTGVRAAGGERERSDRTRPSGLQRRVRERPPRLTRGRSGSAGLLHWRSRTSSAIPKGRERQVQPGHVRLHSSASRTRTSGPPSRWSPVASKPPVVFPTSQAVTLSGATSPSTMRDAPSVPHWATSTTKLPPEE